MGNAGWGRGEGEKGLSRGGIGSRTPTWVSWGSLRSYIALCSWRSSPTLRTHGSWLRDDLLGNPHNPGGTQGPWRPWKRREAISAQEATAATPLQTFRLRFTRNFLELFWPASSVPWVPGMAHGLHGVPIGQRHWGSRHPHLPGLPRSPLGPVGPRSPVLPTAPVFPIKPGSPRGPGDRAGQ